MERRLLLAFVLSAVIFAVWSVLFPPPQPPDVERPTTTPAPATATAEPTAPTDEQDAETLPPPASSSREAERKEASSQRTVSLANDVMRLEVTNRGGAISEFVLIGYEGDEGEELDLVQSVPDPARALPLQLVVEGRPDDSLYVIEEVTARQVVLEYADGAGSGSRKTVTVPETGYGVDVAVRSWGELARADVSLGTGMRDLGAQERDSRLSLWGEVLLLADDELARFKRRKVKSAEVLEPVSVAWVGFDDTYFLQVLRPSTRVRSIRIEPIDFREPGTPEDDDPLRVLRLLARPVGGELEGELLGAPKRYNLLQELGGGLERTLDFGIFGPISVLFLKALWWIHGLVGNYGVAIILLTVGIRVVLFPLMHTSTVSMRKMQKVQPKVKEIQSKYKKKKNDPQARAKMNQEMMELYKQEGVNPMGGCLPLLVQLPILWALYKLFLHAIELRHEPFMLWIQDLSAKDPYYITPILMTATMWLQQRLAPAAGDPQQQRIMRMMPLVFGIMFLQFPSGLVLYWLTNNVLTIIQQEITLNLIGERGRRRAGGGS
jgi:YidC/Oxa1 family membrane protein insertase